MPDEEVLLLTEDRDTFEEEGEVVVGGDRDCDDRRGGDRDGAAEEREPFSGVETGRPDPVGRLIVGTWWGVGVVDLGRRRKREADRGRIQLPVELLPPPHPDRHPVEIFVEFVGRGPRPGVRERWGREREQPPRRIQVQVERDFGVDDAVVEHARPPAALHGDDLFEFFTVLDRRILGVPFDLDRFADGAGDQELHESAGCELGCARFGQRHRDVAGARAVQFVHELMAE